MYQLDRIEVNMLVDIHEVLQAIDEMFEEYELISRPYFIEQNMDFSDAFLFCVMA